MHVVQAHREIVVPAEALTALFRSVSREAGPDVAAHSLRQAGHAAAEQALPQLGGPEGAPGISESAFWERLASFFDRRGWGSLRFEGGRSGVGLLDAHSWADGVEGTPFTEGFLSGILSGVAGAEVQVLCLPGEGEDGTRFAFGSPATIRTLRSLIATHDDTAAALDAL